MRAESSARRRDGKNWPYSLEWRVELHLRSDEFVKEKCGRAHPITDETGIHPLPM